MGLFINYLLQEGEGGVWPWYYASAFKVEDKGVTRRGMGSKILPNLHCVINGGPLLFHLRMIFLKKL
jgi:hypothetical protein